MTAKLAVKEENYRLYIFSFELEISLRLENATYDSTSIKMQLLNVSSRCTKISSTVYKSVL